MKRNCIERCKVLYLKCYNFSLDVLNINLIKGTTNRDKRVDWADPLGYTLVMYRGIAGCGFTALYESMRYIGIIEEARDGSKVCIGGGKSGKACDYKLAGLGDTWSGSCKGSAVLP